jgi:hypothetical protein
MTAGLAQSFYDFYSVPKYQYRGGYLPASDTGDGGWWVWAYTAQFGGGMSGTISTEARRTTQIIDANCLTAVACGGIAPGSFPATVAGGLVPGAGAYGGMQSGDFVGNIRVDQVWGGAQIMAAAHEVNASYYSATNLIGSTPAVGAGHPGDKWGFAVGGGLLLNLPWITQGDSFMTQVNYTVGATRYAFNTPNTNWGMVNGANQSWGVLSDCVYGGSLFNPALPTTTGNATGCNLTTAYGFNAAYEHYWAPAWHTSLYGAWYRVQYNDQANAILCSQEGGGNFSVAHAGSLAVAVNGCNNNFEVWGIGTRTQWDVTKTFYLGVEVLYSGMKSASLGACGTVLNNGTCGAGGSGNSIAFGSAGFQQNSASNWLVSVRAHRDFLP